MLFHRIHNGLPTSQEKGGFSAETSRPAQSQPVFLDSTAGHYFNTQPSAQT